MIIDSHSHVGDLPMFSLSRDAFRPPAEQRGPDVTPVSPFIGHSHVIDIVAAMDVAASDPNVDLETPGAPMHSRIGETIQCVDSHRVRCGSDTPFHHPSGELAKVRVSDLSTDLTDPHPSPTARCCRSEAPPPRTSHDVVGSGKAGSLGFRLIGSRRAPRRLDRHSHRSRRSSNA
jgi:hypothetical protein